MDFFIPIKIEHPPTRLSVTDKIVLIGSCFTEHIGARLERYGWRCCQNPTGIVFNPNSILRAVELVLGRKEIAREELFQHQELWHHWDFHSRFSDLDPARAVEGMNASLRQAYPVFCEADWIFLTLGTANQYFFKKDNYGVNNCHRVPAPEFDKVLLPIEKIVNDLQKCIDLIRNINAKAKFIITVSPVRHIKDGVVENNRSKARLIESAHTICETNGDCYYFPAYELLIDVLRDYRFYDVDLVHPNYAATQTVWEEFLKYFVDQEAQVLVKKMIEMHDAYQHRTRFPESQAHRIFLQKYSQKARQLMQEYPHLDLSQMLEYFDQGTSFPAG